MIVGIDEVGRGCWAGPLLAAAVILDPSHPIAGLNDSKKLSRIQRDKLAVLIHAQSLAIGIGWVWPEAIDISGITAAVKSAMEQAITACITKLRKNNSSVELLDIIIDGSYNFLPEHDRVQTIIKADGLIPEVSAASIIAKVARDTYMTDVAHVAYPEYGFNKHVGYGTAVHSTALGEHGITEIHRRSYKPIKAFLLQSDS